MIWAMRALWSRDENGVVDEIPETIPVIKIAPENLDPKLCKGFTAISRVLGLHKLTGLASWLSMQGAICKSCQPCRSECLVCRKCVSLVKSKDPVR